MTPPPPTPEPATALAPAPLDGDDATRRHAITRFVAVGVGVALLGFSALYLALDAPVRASVIGFCAAAMVALGRWWPRQPSTPAKAAVLLLLTTGLFSISLTDPEGGGVVYLATLSALVPAMLTWRERGVGVVLLVLITVLGIADVTEILAPIAPRLGDAPVPGWVHALGVIAAIGVAASSTLHLNWRLSHDEEQLRSHNDALRDEIEAKSRLATALDAALGESRDASVAKDRFLANMSHEIRTPLAAVISLNDLARAAEDPAERDEFLDLIASSSRHLLEVLNDVLDLSKLESGNLEIERVPTDVRATLDEVARLARLRADSRGLRIETDIDLGIHAWRLSDPMRLKQILHNLMSNAIKFTEQGTVRLTVTSQAQIVRFEVADTGIGMTPEQVRRAVEPFHQAEASTSRRFGGTGLGLAICNGILAHCGQALHIDSSPGVGTTVSFQIPMPPARPIPAHRTVPPSLPIDRPVRALLVEDNAVNQLIASKLLRTSGAEVVAVDNGQQAVERFREGFDLILMDMQMPVMDGLTATREIRRLEAEAGHEAVPIVALTANALAGDEEACREAGMNDYLTKPLDPRQLRCVLRRVALRPAA